MRNQKIKIEAEIVLTDLNEHSNHDDLISAAEEVADEVGGLLEQAIQDRVSDDCESRDLHVSAWVVDEGGEFDG